MIYSQVIWPIVAALWAAFDFVGVTSVQQVRPVNAEQTAFVANYMQNRDMLRSFSPSELRTWVSNNADELNTILKNEGFSIQLQPFNKQEFGVVSILDVMMKWLHEGSRSKISVTKNADSIEYDAFELKNGFSVFTAQGYPHPIIAIDTRNDDGSVGKDRVFITVADAVETGDALVNKVRSIQQLVPNTEEYTHVVIPMIDYDQSFKLDWLIGLQVNGWFVSQALQQTKLKMNEKGARVKSAAAIAMMRSAMPMSAHKLIIDKPFFMWIEREGVAYPVFAGYMDEQFWKDPKGLEL